MYRLDENLEMNKDLPATTIGPKDGKAVLSQVSRDPEELDMLATQHKNYTLCTIVCDAFAIENSGLTKDQLQNGWSSGSSIHWALQYQYEPHPLHLLSGRFSFDRRKQASQRRPFSESSKIVAKPTVERTAEPAGNRAVEMTLSRATGCGTSLSMPDCKYNSVGMLASRQNPGLRMFFILEQVLFIIQ
jgi:hypothetical protein